MATQTARRGWSYAEFASLPDDGNRYEVIDGELFVAPAPRPAHQLVVGYLNEVLGPFVRRHRLGWVYPGPVDVLFADGDYLEPDLVFLRRGRRHLQTERGIEGPPDLVVEVLSPSTGSRDRGIKRERYALHGVPEYWVVDADARRVEVYRPGKDVEVATERLRWEPVESGPVLELDVVKLFADLKPGARQASSRPAGQSGP